MPRFRTIHTSRREGGQIFIPSVNLALGIGCIAIVLAFRSSAALAGAYGLAVSVTMACTTIAYAALSRKRHDPLWETVLLTALFASFDLPFLVGNFSKVLSGGWLPLAIALVLFTLFVTWNRGRRRLMAFLRDHSLPLTEFAHLVRPGQSEGTAVLFTEDGRGIPETLRNWWTTEHMPLRTVVLLTIKNVSRPYVPNADRIEIEPLSAQLVRVRAVYGFMEESCIDDIVQALHKEIPSVEPETVTYYLPSPSIVADTSSNGLPAWQRSLFVLLSRNARSRTDRLGLPTERVMRFGVRIPI